MKKITIILFILFLSLLVTACTNSDNDVEENEVIEEETSVTEETETLPPQAVAVDNAEREIEKDEEEISVPRYTLRPNHTVKPIDENKNEKNVLLTIDDAPERYGVEMAHLLKDKEVNAIFFINGHFINTESGREKLQTIYELGFEIGNHTMTHPNLSKISAEEQRAQIVQLNDLIEEIIGERPRFFRAPFGVNTEISQQIVAEENMQSMNWTYGYDYFKEYMEKEALADIMVNTELLVPGANLLMHDRKWSLEALPEIILGLQNKGYEFVDPKMIKGLDE